MLLDDDGRLAIADFGIARLALEDQLTATGQVLGTAAYISPEQAVGDAATRGVGPLRAGRRRLRAADRASARSQAENFAAQARAHVEDAAAARVRRATPTSRPRSTPCWTAASTRTPTTRWASAGELVDRLERRAATPGPPPPPTAPRAGGGPPRRTAPVARRRRDPGRPDRRRGAAAALAALALVAVLAVVLLTGGDGGGDDQQRRVRRRRARRPRRRRRPRRPRRPRRRSRRARPRPRRRSRPTTPAPSGGTDLDKARDLQVAGLQRPPVGRLRAVARPLPAGARRVRRAPTSSTRAATRCSRRASRSTAAGPPRRGDPGARGAPGPLRRQRGQGGLEGAQGRAEGGEGLSTFDGVAAAIAGVPFMSPEQGRIVYDHVARHPAGRGARARHRARRRRRLHGRGAARQRRGRLTTVDFEGAAYDPSPEDVLARAGRRRPRRGRARVLLLHVVAQGAGRRPARTPHGNCEPRFDFVYLDGAKNWTIDGLAVVLVEKLLRPGGWLLMDDLDWTYAQDPHREATDGIVHRELSEPERTEPHLRAVFELIVAQHPSFTELRVQDEWWGWARKAPGEPRRYSIETSRPLGALVGGCGCARRVAPRVATPAALDWTRQGGPDGEVDGHAMTQRLAVAGGGRARAGGLRSRRRRRRGATDRARPTARRRRPRSTASKDAKGTVTMCAGKDTSGALTEAIKRFNKEHAADGLKVEEVRAGRRRDRGPQPVHPARPGQVGRVRRPAGRHHLDRRVRPAEVAAGPHRLRDRPQGRVHPLDAGLLRLRREALGPPAGHRRRPAVPPQRPGRRRARQLAGALRRRAPRTTASPIRARPTRA